MRRQKRVADVECISASASSYVIHLVSKVVCLQLEMHACKHNVSLCIEQHGFGM